MREILIHQKLNVSCKAQSYIKFIKGDMEDKNIATELRQENLEKFDAEKLIKHEGKKPQSLKIFLDYIGLNEEEFNKIFNYVCSAIQT